MHKPHIIPTCLLVRGMIHRSPLDPTMLRYLSPRPTVIHLMLIFARRGAWQPLDAVIAPDARSEGRRVACAAGLAVGEGAEFGAEFLLEED
jgi:hypothetical protein